jgi:Ohr subfamily peroxiredoxin
MKIIYTAHAEVAGGRDGHARSSDGALDVQLGRPKEFGGGAKPGTNPEQLFAAGYAACFESAVRFVAGQKKVPVNQSSVKASVGVGPREQGGFGLEVELRVSLPGLDRAVAEDLVKVAHEQICPYSNATRGNIDVKVRVE